MPDDVDVADVRGTIGEDLGQAEEDTRLVGDCRQYGMHGHGSETIYSSSCHGAGCGPGTIPAMSGSSLLVPASSGRRCLASARFCAFCWRFSCFARSRERFCWLICGFPTTPP